MLDLVLFHCAVYHSDKTVRGHCRDRLQKSSWVLCCRRNNGCENFNGHAFTCDQNRVEMQRACVFVRPHVARSGQKETVKNRRSLLPRILTSNLTPHLGSLFFCYLRK